MRTPPGRPPARRARSLVLPSAWEGVTRPPRDAWDPPGAADSSATSAACRGGPRSSPAAGPVDLRPPSVSAAAAAAAVAPPVSLPSLPYLPPEILVLIFAAVGWLGLPALRGVCREWRDAADHARARVAAVRATDLARRRGEAAGGVGEDGAPFRPPPTRLSPARVLAAVRLFPALRSLCLSPGRRPSGRGGIPSAAATAAAAARSPYGCSSASVVAALLRVFPSLLGGSLQVLDLSDVGTEAVGDDGRWPATALVLRPAAFRVLGLPGSRLRELLVARCSWWSDDHVAAVVGSVATAADADRGEGGIDTLTMPATGVTCKGLITAWKAAIVNVDVSWCRGVAGCLDLQRALGAAKPSAPSSMSLGLSGTPLLKLRILSLPWPNTMLAVNASHCALLRDVELPSKSITAAQFSSCVALSNLWPVLPLLSGAPGAPLAGGGAVGVQVAGLPHLTTLSLFGCRTVAPQRLKLTPATTPALQLLNVNGVLGLSQLWVDGLPALAVVDAAGCRDLDRVYVAGCPALTRVDLRGKKSPLTRVHVTLPGGGVVLGVRSTWEVWESNQAVRVNYGS
ncbi:hypothetical protein MMPV_008516 [Pyropia vietnamensis]